MQKKTILIAVLIMAAVSANAQTFQQALFLDGYRLGYRYNPALQNQDAFLGVGQVQRQLYNNLGASSFLYPHGDEVVTALHPSVSAYHTVEANVRSFASASIPKEIFAIAKLGTVDTNYDLSGVNVGANAFVELAYGYSHKLSDVFSVGARAKLLIGYEALNYRINKMDVALWQYRYFQWQRHFFRCLVPLALSGM